MIPLCDLVPTRTRPRVVAGILVVQAALAVVSAPSTLTSLPASYGAAPLTWTWTGVGVSLWVSPNLIVLAANLAALWLFGPLVEDRLGRGRVAGLWLLSGAAASLAQIAATPGSAAWLLGATGAAAGVVAAALALHPRGRMLAVMPVVIGFEFVDLPSWLYAVTWATVLLAATITSPTLGLAAAVCAGALTGGAAAQVLRRPERMTVDWWDLRRRGPGAK
jgi:membrane associated rhomboid family serine protease